MKKIILIIILFTLTGCWNYKELNSLAIATGFAVDIVDNEYEVTVLISNAQKESSSDSKGSASAAVYKGKGKTIFEAIKDASLSISKEIYVGHIEVLVLSEEIAKTKALEVIDFFFRYPYTRNQFLLVIAENTKAGDTFEITTPLETYPSQNISKNLEITDKLQGYVYTVTFNDFVKMIIEEGINPTLPTISIEGSVEEGNKEDNIKQNKPNTYLKLGTMAIFKGSNLVGIGTKDQTKGINFINDQITTTLITSQYENSNIVVEINDSSTKVEVDLNKEIPKFKIKIDTIGTITEVTNKVKIEEPELIDKIKKLSEEEIKRICNDGINYAKEMKTDVFGFGNIIYKKDNDFWKKIKENWNNEMFQKVEVELEINLDLKTKGSIDSTIEVR